jgi:cytochrome o ubiquinol oxidase subunit 2
MAGMQTQLHLIADRPGTYQGMSSAFSGPGFSDMHFNAVATSRNDFDEWVRQAKASPLSLDNATYKSLEQPSIKNPVAVYAHVAPQLFAGIVDQYMQAPMEHMASDQTPMAHMAHMAADQATANHTAQDQMMRSKN